MTKGTLETIDGRPALRFSHALAHSIERVVVGDHRGERVRAMVPPPPPTVRRERDLRGLRHDPAR